MPSKVISGLRGTTLDLDRKGRKVPEALVRRLVEGRRRELGKTMKETNAIRRLAERDLRALSTSGKRAVRGAQDAQTMDALRKATRRVSNRKLAAPVVASGGLGGLLTYTLNFTPPYDYVMTDGDIDGGGNLNLRTADLRAGTLDWNIGDGTNDGLWHYSWVELGTFFFPPADQRILNVRANPSYNWSWWIASGGPIAGVTGTVEVGVTGFKGVNDPWESSTPIDVFRPFAEGAGFQFDMGSATNVPMRCGVDHKPADLYLAFVRIFGTVAVGHPSAQTGAGAICGAKMLAAVPSITVEVERSFVVSV